MDRGPLRVPQASDRRVVNRSEAAQRQGEEPQSTAGESKPAQRSFDNGSHPSTSDRAPRKKRRTLLALVLVIIVLALAAAGWFAWSSSKTADTGIDSTRWQAVFLRDGLIYFGKLHVHNGEYLRLTDGYYPQPQPGGEVDTEAEDSNNDSSTIQLIRIGDEVYGPENEIFISTQQVLHYENLRTDSKVAQLIEQNEQSR